MNYEYDTAVLQVTKALRKNAIETASKLAPHTITKNYGDRHFTDGWRVPVDFTDGSTRNIDILITGSFPWSYPRTALVDRPKFLEWPHIERDGILCLLSEEASIDPTSPGDVAIDLLRRSTNLVEDLVEGSIIEKDFKEEFLTYWFYAADDREKVVTTLFKPSQPSRQLSCLLHQGIYYIHDDESNLQRWLNHRLGLACTKRNSDVFRPAALIWLEEPPLPSEYPNSGSDVLKLVNQNDVEAQKVLTQLPDRSSDSCIVILGAEGRGGAGLVAVELLPNQNQSTSRSRDLLSKGFRKGYTPKRVLSNRTYGQSVKTRRLQVDRADGAWVHGRDQDNRSRKLLNKKVTILGCGSVGSLVADNLTKSGVGTIKLIDFDTLKWANIGRHALGATAIGKKKSLALAHELQANYPHLSIQGEDSTIESEISERADGLATNDLIICATGNWSAESLLNEWHLQSKFNRSVLYAWTEEHAVSGSAVIIAPNSRCLACGMDRTGKPDLKAAQFPDGFTSRTEPSCADPYQPYGATELTFITVTIAQAALDELLNPSEESHRTTWFTQRVTEFGGKWSEEFARLLDDTTVKQGLISLSWGEERCSLCRGVA